MKEIMQCMDASMEWKCIELSDDEFDKLCDYVMQVKEKTNVDYTQLISDIVLDLYTDREVFGRVNGKDEFNKQELQLTLDDIEKGRLVQETLELFHRAVPFY